MIVAAGRGTRLAPLTDWVPKPAVPVRGLPLIAYPLALLAEHGVDEVIINLHHLPDALREAALAHCPPGMRLEFSVEEELLDTGGGIRRAADFLRESDPCLILGGDMLLDFDLGGLLRAHRDDAAVTMLLKEDPRVATFGSVGVDAEGVVRRIGSRFDFRNDPGEEARAGIYVWANLVSARAFDSLPEREVFSHIDHWWAPLLSNGARDIRGVFEPCTWEPVGTLPEYLHANFHPPSLRFIDPDAQAQARGVQIDAHWVCGAGAQVGAGASLDRVVVWDGERIPAGFEARNGVFAGGRFIGLPERDADDGSSS
ncbi:MAG: sugar phosphate nucleotidyltransferase [Myxococcota bacterium]